MLWQVEMRSLWTKAEELEIGYEEERRQAAIKYQLTCDGLRELSAFYPTVPDTEPLTRTAGFQQCGMLW
jgi:hypothetical protein